MVGGWVEVQVVGIAGKWAGGLAGGKATRCCQAGGRLEVGG